MGQTVYVVKWGDLIYGVFSHWSTAYEYKDQIVKDNNLEDVDDVLVGEFTLDKKEY
jgi:hypothetical protein